MLITLWCEGSEGKRALFWHLLTSWWQARVRRRVSWAAGNTCFWFWEPWEPGPGHRAPSHTAQSGGLWVWTHTPSGRVELCLSLMSAPAGPALSFSPTDRLMVTFSPAVPHSISELDLNSQVSAGKERQEQFPAAQECCEGRQVHYRQIAMFSDSDS